MKLRTIVEAELLNRDNLLAYIARRLAEGEVEWKRS